MSILLKEEIINRYNASKVVIDPFRIENVGPNSYDVTLDKKLLIYDFSKIEYLDCKKNNPVKEIIIPEEGFILQPGNLYLGNTVESIGSDKFVPMYEGRSSMARLGIQSHLSAGFGDIGFCKQWTLEICVVHPVKIYSGIRIGQVYFHRINDIENHAKNRYSGKYLNQQGPQQSLSYKDNN